MVKKGVFIMEDIRILAYKVIEEGLREWGMTANEANNFMNFADGVCALVDMIEKSESSSTISS